MGTISLQIPQIGQADTTEDVKIANGLTTIQNVINGNIDSTNLAAATAQSAIINQSGQTVKGSSIIATSQNTGSTTFTTLSTPDQVAGIVMPANGLIAVWYQAVWQQSAASAASAAIFVGANQLQVIAANATAPSAQSAAPGAPTGINFPLFSTTTGLFTGGNSSNYTGDVTTGQIVGGNIGGGGGPCYIFAAAGTYTISVQFKASSGTVTAANRKLFVQALSFA